MQLFDRFIGETEVDSSTISARCEQRTDITGIDHILGAIGTFVIIIDNILYGAVLKYRHLVILERTGHTYIHIAVQMERVGAGVQCHGCAADAGIHMSQEELEFTTDGPFVIDLVAITYTNLRVHGCAVTEAREVDAIPFARTQISHTSA